jgi:hypothetical protein
MTTRWWQKATYVMGGKRVRHTPTKKPVSCTLVVSFNWRRKDDQGKAVTGFSWCEEKLMTWLVVFYGRHLRAVNHLLMQPWWISLASWYIYQANDVHRQHSYILTRNARMREHRDTHFSFSSVSTYFPTNISSSRAKSSLIQHSHPTQFNKRQKSQRNSLAYATADSVPQSFPLT